MAEAGLLAGLELVVRLVLVLVHVLQEVQSQGRREWMRKIGVDHNSGPQNDPEETVIDRPESLDLRDIVGVRVADEGRILTSYHHHVENSHSPLAYGFYPLSHYDL